MRIKNIEKSSVIDFPPHISAVVFLGGCCLRCPYCYNHDIINPDQSTLPDIPESEFFEWLKERKGKLGAVCVSGGEPSIHGMELAAFILEIKSLGFKVKLDTNGTNPILIEFLIKNHLIDSISMDVKSSKERYEEACGTKIDTDLIDKSIRTIIDSGIDHEFRTTVHPRLHNTTDLIKIAEWIKGAKTYSIQQYFRADILDPTLNDFGPFPPEWFENAKSTIEKLGLVTNVQIKI